MDKLFDPTRKKYVAATPEEIVRQNFIKFLQNKGFPLQVIKSEMSLDFAGQRRRADIVVFHNGNPVMIIECKAPNVKVDASTFEQVWKYFYSLGSNFLVLTNGKNTFVCKIVDGQCKFLTDFPTWDIVKESVNHT